MMGSRSEASREWAFELTATDLGAVASRRLAAQRGQVHSVYGRAVNVVFPDGIVSVVDGALGRGPLNLTLAAEGVDFPGLVKEGSEVLVSEGSVDLGEKLRIGIGRARRYRNPDHFAHPALGKVGILENVSIARRKILDAGRLDGLGFLLGRAAHDQEARFTTVPFAPRAYRAVLSLSRHLSLGDIRGSMRASQGLIGLGIGLTPSGDDLLSGAIFAMIQGSRNGVASLPGLDELASSIARGSVGRTTLLSQSYLELACGGSANEDVYGFVESLYSGSAEELTRALERLLKYGATSGTDIATGATLGAALAVGEQVMPR